LHSLHLSLRNTIHHRLRHPEAILHLNLTSHLSWHRTTSPVLTWNGKILAGLRWRPIRILRQCTIGRSRSTLLGRSTVWKGLLRVLTSNSCLYGSLKEQLVFARAGEFQKKWRDDGSFIEAHHSSQEDPPFFVPPAAVGIFASAP
jgi:hypothetical protein